MRITLTDELTARGYDKNDIARLTREGTLRHLRRGAYAYVDTAETPHPTAASAGDGIAEGAAPTDEGSAVAKHRELIQATVPQLAQQTYVSHQSAAVLHGLPVRLCEPDRVTVTRPRRNGGRFRKHVHLRVARVQDHEIVEIDGFTVTSVARAVIDIARSQRFEDGVVVADAARAMGTPASELDEAAEDGRHRPGGRRGRLVANFADSRSESPGESCSRAVLQLMGVPAPDIQSNIVDRQGIFVARPDFLWPQFRTVGEFDGRIKYGRALNPGQALEAVLFAEKQREDLLRDLGWQVVRWVWSDLSYPQRIADRLQRAFARGRRS